MFGLPWKLREPVNAKAHGGVAREFTAAIGLGADGDGGQTEQRRQVRRLGLLTVART